MRFHPQFTVSIPIASALNAIERTRGFLEAAQLSKEWLSKKQARALVLEAHHTTHIEGTHLSLDQSERLIAGEKMSGVDSDDVKELLNYRKAFDFVADYVFSQGSITEGLIREIHRRLVDEEYYDRNRQDYYRAIQSVRNNNMHMTGWLEYFSRALETQMREIQLKGSQAIKLDILTLQYKLSERQKLALESLLERNSDFTIQDYELLFPGMNRRSLQRDISDMIEKGLISQEGIKKATRYKVNRTD